MEFGILKGVIYINNKIVLIIKNLNKIYIDLLYIYIY